MAKKDYEAAKWELVLMEAADVATISGGDTFAETPDDWWSGVNVGGIIS